LGHDGWLFASRLPPRGKMRLVHRSLYLRCFQHSERCRALGALSLEARKGIEPSRSGFARPLRFHFATWPRLIETGRRFTCHVARSVSIYIITYGVTVKIKRDKVTGALSQRTLALLSPLVYLEKATKETSMVTESPVIKTK